MKIDLASRKYMVIIGILFIDFFGFICYLLIRILYVTIMSTTKKKREKNENKRRTIRKTKHLICLKY